MTATAPPARSCNVVCRSLCSSFCFYFAGTILEGGSCCGYWDQRQKELQLERASRDKEKEAHVRERALLKAQVAKLQEELDLKTKKVDRASHSQLSSFLRP